MSLNLENKKFIHKFFKELNKSTPQNIADIIETYFDTEAIMHTSYPFNELKGRQNIINTYYKPLLESFPGLKKVPHLLLGGHYDDYREAVNYCNGDRTASLKYQYVDERTKDNPIKPKDGGEWVGSCGYMVASFEKDWIGIPANQQATFIKYGDFYKIVNNKIVEVRSLIDILDVMHQAGLSFFNSPASEILHPGPQTQDGILLYETDPKQTEITKQTVNSMAVGLVDVKNQSTNVWAPNFMWYGPAGIGTTTGTPGFRKYHQQPFVKAHPDRVGGSNHATRFADGNYMAFTGWPSVIGTHTGDEGWLGLPATGKPLAINVMDFYHIDENNQISENWVFIDMIAHLKTLGIDLFKRIEDNLFIKQVK